MVRLELCVVSSVEKDKKALSSLDLQLTGNASLYDVVTHP